MNDRLLSAISLCRKAGKLKMGMDVVKDAAASGEAKLVLTTNDLAERSLKQAGEACMARTVPFRALPFGMEELWRVTGKKYGVLAVCDRGFARMIEKLLSETE